MATENVMPKSVHMQGSLIDSEDFIKGIVRSTLQEFLEAEMTEHIGAGQYERTDERSGQRNGYKPRTINLKVGSIGVSVPQARDGSFHTELFERYQRSERAFTLAVIEMYIKGVSTRKVSDITEQLCGVEFSKSTVSDLCKGLDGAIGVWKSRSLNERPYPYLFVDALYEDVRKDGRVTSSGVLIVTGVRADGRREILDVTIADTESAATYEAMFSSLKERGLSGVLLVTSDAHAGLKAAIARYFQGASWQRCQIHFLRDCTGKVSFRHREELAKDINTIFAKLTYAKALKRATEVAELWREKAPKVAGMLEGDVEQCLRVFAFPEEHQKQLRTNNALERFNEEVRRRTRAIGIFPNEEAALRVIATLCIEKSEDWLSCKPYLDMSLLYVDGTPELLVLDGLGVEQLKKAS